MSDTEKATKHRLSLLKLAKLCGNVSQACQFLGYSRDSFYWFEALYETGGEQALRKISKRYPHPKNRVAEDVEHAVVKLALEQPMWGQARVATELKEQALSISPTGVRCVWLRHGLSNKKMRLKALEKNESQKGTIQIEE